MKHLSILLFFLAASAVFSHASPSDTLKIKIVAYCDHCKACESCWGKIEQNLMFTKGVKHLAYDEKEMVITVGYNPKKVSPEKLRNVVSKSGFDADDIKADAEAQKKLDDCCKRKE